MRHCAQSGFSLLELAIAMTVMTVLAVAGLQLMSSGQNSTFNNAEMTNMYATVRNAGELLGQEIGQAGKPPGPYYLTTSISASGASATVASASPGVTPGIMPGMIVTLDPGTKQEMVQVSTATVSGSNVTFTICTALPTATPPNCTAGGTFAYAHTGGGASTGAAIIVQGAFYQAVGTYYISGTQSLMVPTPTTLMLFGDIRGDGSLVYVQYNCNFNGLAASAVALGTSTPGKLTRSVTAITPSTTTSTVKNTAETIVDNLIFIPDPTDPVGVTPYCFKYQYTPMCNTTPCTDAPPASSVTVYGQAQNMVTGVGLKISVQSQRPDPKTGLYWSLSKSFLNLSPRNVLYAEDMGANSALTMVQPTPAVLPLTH